MPFGLVFFGKLVSFSFHGDAMQKFWPGNFFQVIKDFDQVSYIVSVNRAEVTETQRFKKIALFKQSRFHCSLHFLNNAACIRAKLADGSQEFPHLVFYFVVSAGSGYVGKIFFQRAYIRVYTHAVVVEDN